MKNHTASSSRPDNQAAVTDRVVAYLHQLELEPLEGLPIALKTLEKTGAADMVQTFEALLALLKERGQSPNGAEGLAQAALVLPPLNRQHMISEEMNISFMDALFRVFTGGFRPAPKNSPKKEGNDSHESL